MRRLILVFYVMIFSALAANAQIKEAEMKIYGLTCSLCTRSVEKALEKISYISSIDTDLEHTTTTLVFKEAINIYPEEIADAVEKAGFSVGFIRITYNFTTSFSECYEGEDIALTFLDGSLIDAGSHELLLVQKDLMSNKIFKEYKNSIPEACKTSKKRHYYVALADKLLLN